MTDSPPKKIIIDERYVLMDEVRPGGMSIITKAWDLKKDKTCAVKRMKPNLDEARTKESFNREYKALSELGQHENIVTLIDAGRYDTENYMVLEWLPELLPVSWTPR